MEKKYKDKIITSKSSMNVVAKNKNGLLLEVDKHINYCNDPFNLIYINGSQLDHYNKKGNSIFNIIAGSSNYGHVGDWFNELYKPYIFKYIVNNDRDYSSHFSKSLLELIKVLNTNKNILVGKSYGGVIASVASESNLIKEVYAVNPSISGSPLADIELLKKYKKTLIDCALYAACLRILEVNREFTIENATGIDLDFNEKIKIFGGSINNLKPHTPMEVIMKIGANKIMEITGKRSDGMAIWDEEFFINKGLNYIELDRPFHHRSQNKVYMKTIYNEIKTKNHI